MILVSCRTAEMRPLLIMIVFVNINGAHLQRPQLRILAEKLRTLPEWFSQHNRSHARESFTAIATRLGTDKVQKHSYQHFYESYFHSLRDSNIRLMEIGLGCDMQYGPGVSFQVGTSVLGQVYSCAEVDIM